MGRKVDVNINGNTAGLEAALKKGKNAFNSFSIKGVLAAAGIGAGVIKMGQAIIGATVDVVKLGSGFQKTMAEVKAISGNISDESFQKVTDKARELGATTAFSAQQAAEGFVVLARAGQKTEDQMNTIESALKLAGSGATSIDTAASALVSTLAQFNLGADQASRVADVFGAASSNSQFSVETLAHSMSFGGTAASGFGISLEEATAAQMQLVNIGLEGSKAGTTYRQVLSQATLGTQKQIEALAKYGLTLEDINPKTNTFGEIIQNVADAGIDAEDSIKIFGTEAGSSIAPLINKARDGKNEFNSFVNTLKNSAGTVAAQYDIMMDNIDGQTKNIISLNEELKLSFFDTMGGATKTVLDGVIAVLTQMGSIVRANKVPLTNMFNAVVQVFASFRGGKKDIKLIEISIITFGNIFATIMASIIGLVTTFKLTWLSTKAVFMSVVGVIMKSTATMLDGFISTFDGLSNLVGVFSKDAKENMKGAIDGVRYMSTGLKQTIEEDSDALKNEMYEISKSAEDGMKAVGDIFTAVNMIQIEGEKQVQAVIEDTNSTITDQTKKLEDNTNITNTNTSANNKKTESLKEQTDEMQKLNDELFRLNAEAAGRGTGNKLRGFDPYSRMSIELPIDVETPQIDTTITQSEQMILQLRDVGVQSFAILADSSADFISDVFTGTKDFGSAIKDMFKNLTSSVIGMLSKIASKMAIMGIAKLIFGGATGGFGAAVLKAVGFQGGGFTGFGKDSDIAGVVHKNEYVVDAQTLRRPGVMEMLANINSNQTPDSRTVNIAIPNTPMRDIFVKELRPGGSLYEAFELLGAKAVAS